MRYLGWVFHEEKRLDALPENERRAFECAHLDDAIRVASKSPSARTGSIEVRPICHRKAQ